MRNNVSQPVHKPEAFHAALKLKLIVAGVSPFLCAGLLVAQPLNPNYSLRAWQTGEGLPQDSVTSIVQTPDGYLWVATFNGLARFDGARFTVFDEGNTPALQSSRLVRLDVGYDGRLWIINEQGGLAQLWQGRFRSWTDREGVPAAGVAAMIRGPHRRALLVDRSGGVSQLEGEKWIPDPLSGVAGADRVSFAMDPHERLWVLSLRKRCLGLLAGGQVDWLQGPNGGEPAAVRGLAFSRSGGLWLVLTNRIWHYECEAKDWKATDWVLPESVRSLTCITEDRQGDLWVSSYGCGVLHFGPEGAYEQFTTAEGLSHDAVRALWADPEGSLWVGTDGGGLNRFRRKTVTTYGLRDGLSGEVVMSLAPDLHDRGSLWIGLNGGGLNRLRNPKSTGPLFEPRLLTNAYVYGVLADRQGGLWVGAYDRGILHYADGRLMPLAKSNEWADKPLLAALEDRSGAIWLGGSFGLLRHQRGQLTKLNSQLGGSNLTVRALAEDRAGNVYVGSYGKGLCRFTRGQWTHYRERDGLADDHISCLYVDGEDQLWIGTFNGGLSRWKDGRFANVSMREGLPSNSISSIVEDGDGHLWLGSSRGLFRVRKVQVDELAQGRRHVVTGRTYGLGEGLATLECGGGAQPAACRTDDGRLWFATVKGLTVVDPSKLPVSSSPVPVVLEEVLVDGKPLGVSVVTGKMVVSSGPSARKAQQVSAPVPILAERATVDKSTAALIVPPGSERVEFRFTGLSFLAPEQMRFRFQLEGFDADWIDGGNQRLASYTHIPPGEYVFRVSACNNDGVWSEPGAALGFVVLPPWWATWWFRLAALLTLAALFFGWVELRLSRVRQQQALQEAFSRRLIASQENERQRIAGELHDGMGQDLLVIASQAQLSLAQEQNPPGTVARLKEIADTAKNTLQQARQMAHHLRPGLLNELGLTKAVRATAEKAGQASGVSIAVDLAEVDQLLPPEFEVNLFRIIQESLNNVLKHASATEVKLMLSKHPGSLRLMVEDNGRGFDVGQLGSVPADQRGLGLRQIAERVKIMGGHVDLQSRVGHGTRLSVRVPLGAS